MSIRFIKWKTLAWKSPRLRLLYWHVPAPAAASCSGTRLMLRGALSSSVVCRNRSTKFLRPNFVFHKCFFPSFLLFCPHFKTVTRVTRNAPIHIYELMSWTAVHNSPQHIPNIINPDSGPRFGLCECYVPCSVNHFVFFYGLAASYCEWGK